MCDCAGHAEEAAVDDGAGLGGPWNMQVFAVFRRRPLFAVRQ